MASRRSRSPLATCCPQDGVRLDFEVVGHAPSPRRLLASKEFARALRMPPASLAASVARAGSESPREGRVTHNDRDGRVDHFGGKGIAERGAHRDGSGLEALLGNQSSTLANGVTASAALMCRNVERRENAAGMSGARTCNRLRIDRVLPASQHGRSGADALYVTADVPEPGHDSMRRT